MHSSVHKLAVGSVIRQCRSSYPWISVSWKVKTITRFTRSRRQEYMDIYLHALIYPCEVMSKQRGIFACSLSSSSSSSTSSSLSQASRAAAVQKFYQCFTTTLLRISSDQPTACLRGNSGLCTGAKPTELWRCSTQNGDWNKTLFSCNLYAFWI